MSRRRLLLITHCSLLITLTGCAPHRSSAPAPHLPAAPPDPWIIHTTSPDGAYRPTYLGNGDLGQVMAIDGLGMIGGGAPGAQGRVLAASDTTAPPAPAHQPACMAGLYNEGRLVSLPPLFPLRIEAGGPSFGADPAKLSSYSQALDLRHGLLATRATWTGAPVEITAFVARDDPTLAVCHVVAPSAVRVRDAANELPAGPDHRPPPGPAAAAGTLITSQSHRTLVRTSRLLAPDGAAPPGAVAATLVTQVAEGVSRGDTAGPSLQETLQRGGGEGGVFASLLKRHTAAWEKVWASDIEIEGNPADQQLVHALMYQVLASVREGVTPAPGFPPMGLSNAAAFDGHVFWDADTWIFPALLPLHPEMARTILDYRLRTLPGAEANAAGEGKKGASYAWESADTGREVATLDTRHGRHVSADVALAHWNYYLATGDRAWLRQRGWPVLSATADYWVTRAVRVAPSSSPAASPTKRSALPHWEIRRVSTPDENAGLVDNSAWTNFTARENLRAAVRAARLLGLPADPRWTQVAEGLLIPRDASGMILEYSGYHGQPAKQADTLLLLFPGDLPLPRADQERLFRYYVDRTIRSGPAMTESVHAVIAARLGHPDEAYRRFRQSVDPFVRPPFLSFSEKRTRDNLQFLTGAAGSLQSILYGFAGLRLQDSPTPVLQPQLPPAWSGLTLRNLAWRGKRYDVLIRRGQPVRIVRR